MWKKEQKVHDGKEWDGDNRDEENKSKTFGINK